MNSKPLISVIVPVYNVAPYLDQCVKSIVDQTYTNLEIILVDDGSTDESGAMCDAWATSDKRVTALHKENGGQSSARNRGLQEAHGEYISYVDSDDYIHVDMLETLIKLIESNGAQAAGCQFVAFEGCKNHKYKCTEQLYIYSGRDVCNKMIEQIPTAPRISCAVWKFLYQASAIQGVTFEEGVYYEDTIYSIRAMWHMDKVVFCDKPLYFYRIRSSSTTHVALTKKHAADAIHFITWIYDFYQEHGDLEEKALERSNALQQIYVYRNMCPSNLRDERAAFSRLIETYDLGYKDLQSRGVKPVVRYIVYKYFDRAWSWLRLHNRRSVSE